MPEKITSLQNPRIKNLQLLQLKSRERRKQNLLIVEGFREIERAMLSGFILRELYYFPIGDISDKLDSIIRKAGEAQIFEIGESVFIKLAYREHSDGLLALLEAKPASLSSIELGANPFIIVLESVEKPGNLGAIMRTADASGADAVIICDPLTDIYNPNTIRSSVGCIFTCQVAAAATEEVQSWLKEKKINVYLAALSQKSKNYFDFDYTTPAALVMGTEATGLSDQWLSRYSSHILVPMLGVADSLNVSVCTAVLAYEVVRQRQLA